MKVVYSVQWIMAAGGVRKAWLFAALLLAGLLYPGAVHEYQRWEECLNGCSAQFEKNTRILQLDVCQDQFKLFEHGENARTMCNTAAFQNQASPVRCAWRRFWKQGEVYALYKRVAHSQWMLYGIILPTLLFTIYMLFSTYRTSKEGARQEREQHAMLETMKYVARRMSSSQMVPYQAPTAAAAAMSLGPEERQEPVLMLADTAHVNGVPRGRRYLKARRRSRQRRSIPNSNQMVTVL